MLIQKQEIKKVLLTNCKQQIKIFNSIRQQLSETNNLQSVTQKAVKSFEQIENLMLQWRQLTQENQLLLQNYKKQCGNGEINKKQFENMKLILNTQHYIKEQIQSQSKLSELYQEGQFILWIALLKYNSRNLEAYS